VFLIKDLIKLLVSRAHHEKSIAAYIGSEENSEIEKVVEIAKSSAIQIILLFTLVSTHALDDLGECSKVILY